MLPVRPRLVLALSAAFALLAAGQALAQTASRPGSQEIADFWETVFRGPAPYGLPPLNASRTNPRTISGCTVWDVRFDSYKDPETNLPVRLGGVLAVPNAVPPPGPGGTWPGLVVTHSVGSSSPQPDNVVDMSTFFALKGYAALAFFMRGWGTSPMSVNADFFTDYLAPDGQMPLDNRFTGMAADCVQAAEFLAVQPEVWNPNRLSYVGHSGGGYSVLAGLIFSPRCAIGSASAPAAAWPDAGAWLNYALSNGSFTSIQTWINAQPNPAYARSLVERTLTFVSMYQAINNPFLVAKDPTWKLDNASIFFYGGQTDVAIPPWDVEDCYLLADASNDKAFHWSPTGGHGGPESWERAQAWIAGHYPGISAPAPVAALAVPNPTDSDGDGLPDAWETGFFGGLSQTAAGDPDGDGWSNLSEYQAGTDPTSAASVPGGGASGGSGGGGCGATGLEALLLLALRRRRRIPILGLALILLSGFAWDGPSDDFERDALGADWTLHVGNAGIVKGDLALLAKGLCLASWGSGAFEADQFSEAALSSEPDPMAIQQVFVRRREKDGARYGFHWNPAEGGRWEIKLDGVPTKSTRLLATAPSSAGPAAGDRLRLEARGKTLRALHNGAEILKGEDTSSEAITEAGRPGVAFFSRGTAFPARIFASWRGGTPAR